MESIKSLIIKYLQEDNQFIWGGVLCRYIHEETGTKESVIERRCRELAHEGTIEVIREQVEGKGPHCVKYRAVEQEEMTSEYESHEEANLKLL